MEKVPKQVYTKEFREQAAKLVLQDGMSVPEAARRSGRSVSSRPRLRPLQRCIRAPTVRHVPGGRTSRRQRRTERNGMTAPAIVVLADDHIVAGQQIGLHRGRGDGVRLEQKYPQHQRDDERQPDRPDGIHDFGGE